MAIVKFNEKNQVIYFGLQSAQGSKVLTSALDPTTAIACTNLSGDPTLNVKNFQYLGDSLSRDEVSYLEDEYIDLKVDTYQQILFSLAAAINPDTNSIWKMFQTCGGRVDVDAGTKFVTVSNIAESPDYATGDFRLSSPDDATNDKLYKFYDLRGTVDTSIKVGEVPDLKFSLKGNVDAPATSAKQIPNFATQVTQVAPAVLQSSVLIAQLAKINDTFANPLATYSTGAWVDYKLTITFSGAHSIPVDNIVAVNISGVTNATIAALINGVTVAKAVSTTAIEVYIKGLTGTGSLTGTVVVNKGDTPVSTFCMDNSSAPNFFGFDFARYQTSCIKGFDKKAIATDVSISMIEDQVGGDSFNPDANKFNFYGCHIQVGTDTAGHKIGYFWNKLQLSNVKQGKIATFLSRDVTFRNTGNSFMFYS